MTPQGSPNIKVPPYYLTQITLNSQLIRDDPTFTLIYFTPLHHISIKLNKPLSFSETHVKYQIDTFFVSPDAFELDPR